MMEVLCEHSLPATIRREPCISYLEKSTVSPNISISCLPSEALQRIFKHLSYKDISKLRLLNTKFSSMAAQYLNSSYNRLRTKVSKGLKRLKRGDKPDSKRKYRVLCTLRSEFEVLHAICWKYLEGNHVCFFAGGILDEFDKVIRLCSYSEFLSDDVFKMLDQLFALNERFVDKFLQCPKVILSTNFALDVIDVFTGCSHVYGSRTISQGSITVSLYFRNTYFEWGYLDMESKSKITKAQEANALFRSLVPFVFNSNRNYHVGKPRKTKSSIVNIGDKYFKFTQNPIKFQMDWCWKLEVEIGLQYPFNPDMFFLRDNAESEFCYMHRLYRSLPEKRNLQFNLKNVVPGPGHTCSWEEYCWDSNVASSKYCIDVESDCGHTGGTSS